jgi:hypothetical protein
VTKQQIADWCAQQYSEAKVQMVLSSIEFDEILKDSDVQKFKVMSFSSTVSQNQNIISKNKLLVVK